MQMESMFFRDTKQELSSNFRIAGAHGFKEFIVL
jgi:hypothetical protein